MRPRAHQRYLKGGSLGSWERHRQLSLADRLWCDATCCVRRYVNEDMTIACIIRMPEDMLVHRAIKRITE